MSVTECEFRKRNGEQEQQTSRTCTFNDFFRSGSYYPGEEEAGLELKS
jgi:hypothetical protein